MNIFGHSNIWLEMNCFGTKFVLQTQTCISAKWWPTLLLSCSTMASQKRCAQYQQKTFLDKVHPSERQIHRVQRLERCRLMSGAPAIVSRRYWTRWARFASFVEDERLSKQSILMNAIITTPTTTIIIMFLSTNWRWICANKCRWPPGQKI